jgi:tetratricopeptide (TPR) repeat protein
VAAAKDLIAQRFELERIAGRGGTSEVWRAFDRVEGAPVAVKLLSWAVPHGRERFEREGRMLAELGHPGIVRYVDHGQAEDGLAYVAMEWLEGETLAKRMARQPLSPAESIDVVRRVAEALGAAHAREIVHRDVKPNNVLLVGGDLRRPKLLDFGVALLESAGTVTTQKGLLGTPSYMAPEQVRAAHTVDARADVFSLGCVLFRALTGRVAFESDSLPAIVAKILHEEPAPISLLRPEVPAALEALVARMLSKHPEGRPRDGAAVAAELGGIAIRGPGSKPALGPDEQRIVSVVMIDGEPAHLAATRALASKFGAQLDVLRAGAAVALLENTGEVRDLAARSAACALALRAACGAPASLAMGRAVDNQLSRIGEPIERAARLLRAGDGVWIDDVTAGVLDARFEVVTAGDPPALLLRRERDPDEPVRTLLGRPSPYVGRDRELAALEAIFAQCRAEQVARAVLVTAAPGMGKSRLRQEFLRRLRERRESVEVLVGRGDSVCAPGAFGMLSQAVRATAGVIGGQPVELAHEKLRAWVARAAPASDGERVARLIGEMVGVPSFAAPSPALRTARADAMLRGDQIRAAFEDLVDAACAERPVLLVLDDLHWADRPTVALVDRLLRNLRHRPLMVLALARAEVRELFPNLWAERDVEELRLGRLTPAASSRLARTVLGEGIEEATVARIVEHADGNALCLEELCHAVVEGRVDTLPGTVLATVQARLATLDADTRRVLRAASIFGRSFWAGGVRALLAGLDPNDWIDALTQREIVLARSKSRFGGELEYGFRHDLIREASYGTLTEDDRTLGHKLAAAWLESVGETDALLLAEHFERGGEGGRAVAWFRRAAEEALAGNDFAAAAARADRGVECGAERAEHGALRLVKAEALRWQGRITGTAAAAREAVAALPACGALWYHAVAEAGAASYVVGHAVVAAELARQAGRAPADDEAEGPRAVCCARIALALLASGRDDQAAPLFAIIEPFAEARDPGVRALVLRTLANRDKVLGKLGHYVERMEEAIRCHHALGDLRNACTALASVADGYASVGQYDRAEAAARSSLATAERLGLASTAYAKQTLGHVLMRLGRLEDAERIEVESSSDFERQGNMHMFGGSLSYVAIARLLAGDPGGAEERARHSLEVIADVPPLRCHTLGLLADALLAQGRVDHALATSTEALELLTSLGTIDEGEHHVRLVHAEALRAAGRDDEARTVLEGAKQRLLERAEAIAHDEWRTSFLERVPENARILALAREWRDEAV